MRKQFLLWFIVVSIPLMAQNSIPTGEYVSITPNSKGLNFSFQENNRFQMIMITGSYKNVNDTIVFHTDSEKEPNFNVLFSNSDSKAKAINIKFNVQGIYGLSKIYVGIQKTANDEIEYKSITEYISIGNSSGGNKAKEYSFEVDKASFLYLALKDSKKKGIIEKYEIPKECSEITIEYVENYLNNLNLIGFFDHDKNELIITEGLNPLTFIKKNVGNSTKNFVQPAEKISKKNWSYPGMKKDYTDLYPADSVSVDVIDEPRVPPYSYKHTLSKSYPDAMKALNNKTTKFLVVSFDDSKNAKTSFDNFIKDSENELSNFMYDGYNSEIDNFNFYKATEKDKNLLSKYQITKTPSLLFFNSKGDLVYHTEGNLYSNEAIFGAYTSIYNELQNANQKIKIDAVFANKKANLNEFKTVFKEIAANQINPLNAIGAAYEEVRSVRDYDEAVVDTATTVDYDSFYRITDRENLYKVKTSKQALLSKWGEIIDFHSKNSQIDSNFVAIVKSELKNRSLTSALFDSEPISVTDTDFKLLDYVFKNYTAILKDEEEGVKNAGIDTALSSFFSIALNSSEMDKEKRSKLLNYNKKFLELSGYNFVSVQSYLITLKENDLTNLPEYTAIYSDYFDSLTKDGANIYEVLDQDYTLGSNGMGWTNFKDEFTHLANTIAWYVVENSADASLIQKAIKWSEMSLKLEKDNPYYLDTLAQLYYKNGQKQKAIATEEKAVEIGTKTPDFNDLETYKKVLEKMKNGTY